MRALAVFRRVLRGFKRDKRSLTLLMLAPVLVLSLLWVIFGSDAYDPRLAAVELPGRLVQSLEERGARIQEVDGATAERLLVENEVDAVVRLADGRLTIRLEGGDPIVSRSVRLLFFRLMQDRAAGLQEQAKLLA